MRKIKIVFILGRLDIGGTERQFLETVRRLDQDRFDLRVLAFSCHGRLRTEIERLHIPFTCLGFSGLKGKFHPGSYVQLYRLIRDMVQYLKQEKPEIVQSYLFWTNVYGCIAAKIAGVPIIVTGKRGINNKPNIDWSQRWLQNFSNLWATTIIANSHTGRQRCLEQERYVSEEKVRVIYNGIDFNRYIPCCKNKRKNREFNIPDNYHVVGIIANLYRYKGHQDFLKTTTSVLQTYPQTIFLIIGRDEGIKVELESLAKKLHIVDSIIFTGERDDIQKMISMLDVQVSSSLDEGLSNAILEGMAMGKPIIATDVGGNPELVVHEQTGLLVPPENPNRLAEAIIRLLGDQKLREKMGTAGRQRIAALFRIENMVEQTETLYQSLVDNEKRRNR